ncbi:hypothetical protein Q4551_15885 [Oceanobacter sp. 5_MG-2023]|uniref:hypothetical protein n=1 Tax=Oceanobacter sp. 5_MG-2023 TaxID=3062645 RepID=UPI0026E3942C|nr:hypothetical protein [Oceanobacter sp. 5_MG-2023]MDO6683772.1 hypothetical protein [Oceanobacter sp. 5_MG-2023]
MTNPEINPAFSLSMQEAIDNHKFLCRKQLNQVILGLMVVAVPGFFTAYLNAEKSLESALLLELTTIELLMAFPIVVVLLVMVIKYYDNKYITTYHKWLKSLETATVDPSINSLQSLVSEAKSAADSNHLVMKLLEYYQPLLNERISTLNQNKLTKSLKAEFNNAKSEVDNKLKKIRHQIPLLKTRGHIYASWLFLKARRREIDWQWTVSYNSFSWWDKLKYLDGPDFVEIDKAISELDVLRENIDIQYEDELNDLNSHLDQLREKAIMRISAALAEANRYVECYGCQENFNSNLLQKSFWLAALSVPVSVWNDIDNAGDVYDALRSVNTNFSDMSDVDIWWESLFLSTESLAGLAALTKGAYFEQLVAADTGGQLHEHFNHEDTDIVIDGVEFQIKATDSETYIYSVEESIPVIATSEVALTTGAMDGGYSNVDITSVVDRALGGSIVDIGDTAGDAILTGLGGLGFFATIDGINHASDKYKNGGDAVEAIFAGAGVAVEGTAKAMVDAAEMGYKVLASKPSRFMGRMLLSGLKSIDEKIMEGTKH